MASRPGRYGGTYRVSDVRLASASSVQGGKNHDPYAFPKREALSDGNLIEIR